MSRNSSRDRTNPDTDRDHLALAKSRLRNFLSRRVVATARIFEGVISDAGERSLEPHILAMARKALVLDGELEEIICTDKPSWFHLPDASLNTVEARCDTLSSLLRKISRQAVARRRGQCLELAVYRALGTQTDARYLGRFPDFDLSVSRRTKNLYRKEEPPSYIGNRAIPGESRLDFLYLHRVAGLAGVETKNIREWLYPGGAEVVELLHKCVALDCVPVLVTRRLPSVSFNVLGMCGVVLHETRNQLYHVADEALADRAKRQDLLGYVDIRVGDKPDARLLHFIRNTLPEVLPDARTRFDKFKDLLARYAEGGIPYHEFAGRVRRRVAGKEEDDWEDGDQYHPDDNYYY